MTEFTVGALCAGYDGIGMALAALGGRTIWVADNDPDASLVLAARYPDVPNHGDITTIDWAQLEAPDTLTAGYPCQPFSTAGPRLGEHDERHIWPDVCRAIRALRPRRVVLENVAGHLSLGFGRVLGDLADSGYVGSWVRLPACAVGAPHERERVWIVASDAHRVGAERRGGSIAVAGTP